MKILILGHARHGKDHAAEYLHKHFGLKFTSSSLFASKLFIFDKLKKLYNYKTPEECFTDRINHREEWFNLISEYNKVPTKLAEQILKHNDCYVGMRSNMELQECIKNKLFDIIIWIDASNRLPLESSNSLNINKENSHIILLNNTTIKDFEDKLYALGRILFRKDMDDRHKINNNE